MTGSRDISTADIERSIQERLYPDGTCFGCGPANPRGLRLRSFAGDGVVRARFEPWPEHDNGAGFLNGGIIATVMDCHSGAAVFQEAATMQSGEDPAGRMLYVTAGFSVQFLRPCPLVGPVTLSAVVTSASADEMTVAVALAAEGKPRAEASAVWKRWRARD